MTPEVFERATLRKVAWKLIPFVCALYTLNILDRANVGFARLKMQGDLDMTDVMFDFGYGLFYIGYLVFEVPSNLMMRKVGARRWIARIMISWGIVSCLTMFVVGPISFYSIRILLGVAEAGFFPGIILYLSYWFPQRERAKMTAYFMMAISLANMLGNPISGWIMQNLNAELGLHGWQWLFLLEGIPSILLGAVVLYKLTDRPSEAHWLEENERTWLVNRMQREESERTQAHGADKLGAMFDGRVWLLIAIYFTVAVTSNAGGAYFPTILKDHFADASTAQIGVLSALPHLCAAIGMVLFGISSDRTGKRKEHVAAAALVGAAGWALTAIAPTPAVALGGLCLAQVGMMSMLPTFWALPTAFLSGAAAAGGIALISSVANIGGFLGASILGQFGTWSMVVSLMAGAALAMLVRRNRASNEVDTALPAEA
jgi:ACS family tartrate transporter-like MFS transporter